MKWRLSLIYFSFVLLPPAFSDQVGGDERLIDQVTTSNDETEQASQEIVENKCPNDVARAEINDLFSALIAKIAALKKDVADMRLDFENFKKENSRSQFQEEVNTTPAEEESSTPVTPPPQVECEPNTFNLTTLDNGKKYFFSQRRVDWYRAQKICENNHMHLASPKKMEEFQVLRDYLVNHEIFDSMWLSASDVDRMGKGFVWHDGEDFPANSSLWGNGPYSYGVEFGEELCVHTGITLLGEQMCVNRLHFVCELPSDCY